QKYFDAHPEVDVVFGDYIVTDPHGHPVALRREIPFRKFYVANSFLNMQSATIFFRRKLWDSGILKINSKYRYAADKDLILRIAEAGHLIHHIPDYFSLFGIDGTNLSTHPQMGKESEEIRIAFGAYKSQPLRKLALMGRRFERLFIGSYRSKSISYKYALNEEPRYEDHTATNLGGRYALTAFTGQANSLRNTYSK
ncbi:MAG: hypothetical protein H7240_11650, partial [Glaciimonas sp.]|nr:hypothetical protein [Glaciimonas sp.]